MAYEHCIYPNHMIKYIYNDRILERKKDTILSETKQEDIQRIKSKMEGGQADRQRWICSCSNERTPSLGQISWIYSRASNCHGKRNRKIPVAYGNSTSQKRKQTGQPNRKFGFVEKFIRPSEIRMERGYV